MTYEQFKALMFLYDFEYEPPNTHSEPHKWSIGISDLYIFYFENPHTGYKTWHGCDNRKNGNEFEHVSTELSTHSLDELYQWLVQRMESINVT